MIRAEDYAQRHHIPMPCAVAYLAGRHARLRSLALPGPVLMDAIEAWYRAGWHDQDITIVTRDAL